MHSMSNRKRDIFNPHRFDFNDIAQLGKNKYLMEFKAKITKIVKVIGILTVWNSTGH